MKWLFQRELPVPRRRIHHRNDKYAGHYRLLDDESIKGFEFCRELLAPAGRILRWNGFLPEIASSWMRIPPEKWNFAGNHQLQGKDSHRKDKKSFEG
jgi:hypothetical protein